MIPAFVSQPMALMTETLASLNFRAAVSYIASTPCGASTLARTRRLQPKPLGAVRGRYQPSVFNIAPHEIWRL